MSDQDIDMTGVGSNEAEGGVAPQAPGDAVERQREQLLEDELEALLSEVLGEAATTAGSASPDATVAYVPPSSLTTSSPIPVPAAPDVPLSGPLPVEDGASQALESLDAPTLLMDDLPQVGEAEAYPLQAVAPEQVVEPMAAATVEVPLMQATDAHVDDDDAMLGYGPRHGEGPAGSRGGGVLGMLKVVVGVALVLAAAYLGGVALFTFYFMPNTTINGENVSFMLASEVAERHTNRTESYTLHVSGEGLDLAIKAEDVNLRSDGLAYVTDARDQLDPWRWPYQITQAHDLTVEESITFDQQKATQVVESAVRKANEGATQPKDATIAFDEVTHLYHVVPEVLGSSIDAKAVTTVVNEALVDMRNRVELTDDVMLRPAVTSDDERLNATVDDVNAHLGATQQLMVGDKEVFVVDASVIGRFTKVSDDLKVTVDHEALKEWAQGELSEKLDTTGSHRSLVRPDGKKIEVKGGNYGWTINGAELAETIATNIEEGTSTQVEIPMLETAQIWNPGGQEWGKRYIDIDITEQHVRMYDDSGSLIWESDCVTGNPTEGHDTPEGVFALNSNREKGNVVLEGPEDEKTKEPEYVSYVTYWMPFVWNSVALHDATWRYSFGGDIYRTDGSHGCVNLPYDKAEQLFNITQVGDVVVVHY